MWQSSDYLVGDRYSIADIASFAWVRTAYICDLDLSEHPGVAAWVERIAKREAVTKGLAMKEGSVTEEHMKGFLQGNKAKIAAMVNSDKR